MLVKPKVAARDRPVKGRGSGRKMTHATAETARRSIKVGMILARLQAHLEGTQELTPTQATAAKTLLDRAMPTLTAVEMTQVEEVPAERDIIASIKRLLERNPELKQALASSLTADIARGARASQDVEVNQDSTKAA